MDRVTRVALCGPPGSGKSTIRRICEALAPDLGFTVHHLRLADPLYAAQREIYRLSGRPLTNDALQDGRLLNLLGVEMRRINALVLADHARSRLVTIAGAIETQPGSHLVVCDDMRPPDADFMRSLGFQFVGVQVPTSASEERRRLRGDVTLGSKIDPNEVGLDEIGVVETINNAGSLEVLTQAVGALLQRLLK